MKSIHLPNFKSNHPNINMLISLKDIKLSLLCNVEQVIFCQRYCVYKSWDNMSHKQMKMYYRLPLADVLFRRFMIFIWSGRYKFLGTSLHTEIWPGWTIHFAINIYVLTFQSSNLSFLMFLFKLWQNWEFDPTYFQDSQHFLTISLHFIPSHQFFKLPRNLYLCIQPHVLLMDNL